MEDKEAVRIQIFLMLPLLSRSMVIADVLQALQKCSCKARMGLYICFRLFPRHGKTATWKVLKPGVVLKSIWFGKTGKSKWQRSDPFLEVTAGCGLMSG